jgi:hypothetical protein
VTFDLGTSTDGKQRLAPMSKGLSRDVTCAAADCSLRGITNKLQGANMTPNPARDAF